MTRLWRIDDARAKLEAARAPLFGANATLGVASLAVLRDFVRRAEAK